jgi:ribonucleotide reductase alpha subunit
MTIGEFFARVWEMLIGRADRPLALRLIFQPTAREFTYIASPSGKQLDALYRLAWRRGLKTTYYLRSRSATHVEKSTLKSTDGKLNAVSAFVSTEREPIPPSAAPCPLDDSLCEACQ